MVVKLVGCEVTTLEILSYSRRLIKEKQNIKNIN